MTHTSGPWEVVLVDDGMTNEVTFIIRMGSHLGGKNFWEPQHRIDYASSTKEASPEQFGEAQANARLIAAAPDLLDALKAALPYVDDASDVHSLFPDSASSVACRAVVAACRVAIAKASAA